jgi:hypothetical protein
MDCILHYAQIIDMQLYLIGGSSLRSNGDVCDIENSQALYTSEDRLRKDDFTA